MRVAWVSETAPGPSHLWGSGAQTMLHRSAHQQTQLFVTCFVLFCLALGGKPNDWAEFSTSLFFTLERDPPNEPSRLTDFHSGLSSCSACQERSAGPGTSSRECWCPTALD